MVTAEFPRRALRALTLAAAAAMAVALGAQPRAAVAQAAVVGILEGQATLLRPTGKFELAEGVALHETDIVETAAGAFVQIELADGVRVGLGDSSRLMLSAAAAPADPNPARLRLLQGWMKLTAPADKAAVGEFVTPRGSIGALAGTCVVNADAAQFALFVESGGITWVDRALGAAPRAAKGGDFISARGTAALAFANRPAAEFVARLPRLFRDALPARAAKFRDRTVTPRSLGDVSYDDIATWLQAEAAVRVPLIPTWRVRLADKAFREAVLTHLASHPEWRPLVIPPKPKPRPPEQPAIAPRERASEPSPLPVASPASVPS